MCSAAEDDDDGSAASGQTIVPRADYTDPVDMPDFPAPAPNGQEPPTTIPTEAGLPCGGQGIDQLKPALLAMLISKVARLAQEKGGRWQALLEALQAERARRLARRPVTTVTPDRWIDQN
jgi:hypothetical protein